MKIETSSQKLYKIEIISHACVFKARYKYISNATEKLTKICRQIKRNKSKFKDQMIGIRRSVNRLKMQLINLNTITEIDYNHRNVFNYEIITEA